MVDLIFLSVTFGEGRQGILSKCSSPTDEQSSLLLRDQEKR